jgi:hypothetical protein
MQIGAKCYQAEIEQSKQELQVSFGGRSYRICLKGQMPYNLSDQLKVLMKLSRVAEVPLSEASNIYEFLRGRFGAKQLRHRHQLETAFKTIADERDAIQIQRNLLVLEQRERVLRVIDLMRKADFQVAAAKERISGESFFSWGGSHILKYWDHIRTCGYADSALIHFETWQKHLILLIGECSAFADEEVFKLVGLRPEEKADCIELLSREFYKIFLDKLLDVPLCQFGECVRDYCRLQLSIIGPSLFKLKLEEILRNLLVKMQELEGLYQSESVFKPKEFAVTNFDKMIDQSFTLFLVEGSLEAQLIAVASYKNTVFGQVGIDDEAAFKNPAVIQKNIDADRSLLNAFGVNHDVVEPYWRMVLSHPNGYWEHQKVYSNWISFYQRLQDLVKFDLLCPSGLVEKELVENVMAFEAHIFSWFSQRIESDFMSAFPFSSRDEKLKLGYAKVQLVTIGRIWMQAHIRSIISAAVATLKALPFRNSLGFEAAKEERDLNINSLTKIIPYQSELGKFVEIVYGCNVRISNPWNSSLKGLETVAEFFIRKAAERENLFKKSS